MGYLNKSAITVDAILTRRGREILSQNASNFVVTKFAVADDEVDYTLYNTAHPLGSSYYGSIIENMPVMEATPDETQTMRYKLVTLTTPSTGGAPSIPIITLNGGPQNGLLTLQYDNTKTPPVGTYAIIRPTTTNATDETYTLVLSDGKLATVTTSGGTIITKANGSITATTSGDVTFKLTAKNIQSTGTVTVYGNNSGAVSIFTLSVTNS